MTKDQLIAKREKVYKKANGTFGNSRRDETINEFISDLKTLAEPKADKIEAIMKDSSMGYILDQCIMGDEDVMRELLSRHLTEPKADIEAILEDMDKGMERLEIDGEDAKAIIHWDKMKNILSKHLTAEPTPTPKGKEASECEIVEYPARTTTHIQQFPPQEATPKSEEWDWIRGYFKTPFNYDKQGIYVRDARGRMVCDIRGRGAIQGLENPEQKQDSVGMLIAELLNNYFANLPKEPTKEEVETKIRHIDLNKEAEEMGIKDIAYLSKNYNLARNIYEAGIEKGKLLSTGKQDRGNVNCPYCHQFMRKVGDETHEPDYYDTCPRCGNKLVNRWGG